MGGAQPASAHAISKSEERYAPTNRPDGLDVVTISAVIEHYLQLDGANVVNTPDFALALENMRYVRRRHAISLFFGDPGVGKTIAAQAIADSIADGEGCVVKLTTAPNPRMLANAILEKLTGVFHDETRWEAARTLTRELREHPRMVIVDEAQNAGLDCIEWLRWLHEEVPGRLTLLFVGGPQVRARVMRSPQLTPPPKHRFPSVPDDEIPYLPCSASRSTQQTRFSRRRAHLPQGL